MWGNSHNGSQEWVYISRLRKRVTSQVEKVDSTKKQMSGKEAMDLPTWMDEAYELKLAEVFKH